MEVDISGADSGRADFNRAGSDGVRYGGADTAVRSPLRLGKDG